MQWKISIVKNSMMNILKTVTEKIFKMLFYVRAGKYPAAPLTAQSEGRGERREAQLSSPASKAAPKTLSVDWQLASQQHGRWRRPSLHCQPMPQRCNTRYKRLDRELSLKYFGFMWDCGEGVGEAQFLSPPSSRLLSFCRHIIWNKLSRRPHLGRSLKFSAHRTL